MSSVVGRTAVVAVIAGVVTLPAPWLVVAGKAGATSIRVAGPAASSPLVSTTTSSNVSAGASTPAATISATASADVPATGPGTATRRMLARAAATASTTATAIVRPTASSAAVTDALATSATRMPRPGDTRDCTTSGCHDGYAKRVVHGPVMSGDCDACHEPTAPTGHRFRLVEQRAALCEACHDEFDDDVVHQPVADGQCTTCHDPHAADVSGLLTEPSVGALCRQCHEDVTDGLTFLHGPVAAGACTACHDPHAAEHASLLPTEDRALCVGCHAPLADRMAGLEHVHEPARSSCLACHNPHGADNRRNLASGVPELCTDCHDTIADIMEDAEFQHDALTTGRSCLACHDPHATSVAHTLRAEPLTLCLSCHDKTLDTGGETVRNIAAVLAANPDHHGPVRDGDCTACHEVHGGDHFRMLVDAYPAGFYAPFDESRYALCFGCHDVEMLEDEETDDLTNFRNGERNLHYLHVNRDVKGRSCRACHDPHASKRPVHIAESAPFGQWRIPINFSKTDTGGSCAPGCHKRYRYDRIEPVVNLPPAADPGAVSAGSATGTVAKKD